VASALGSWRRAGKKGKGRREGWVRVRPMRKRERRGGEKEVVVAAAGEPGGAAACFMGP
jgi:hypothetical protein